jgi:hypothetical protein
MLSNVTMVHYEKTKGKKSRKNKTNKQATCFAAEAE